MCDTVVVVHPDRVLFAKNSDRDPNEAQLLDWQPAQVHPAGSKVRCTYLEIPQVRQTHAVLLSRPFWMWGAEIGANEHGVVIGNEAVFTNQPYAAEGLTGMDLLRLALERADSAAKALETITQLLHFHGQGGGCGHENRKFTYHNSFLIADAREAYVLETAGKKWASENVTGARSISNGLTIPSFAANYSDKIKTWGCAARSRCSRTQLLAADAQNVSDMMRVLRDHGDGRDAPEYSLLNGAMSAPCMHAGGLAAASQTTASWVSELRPTRIQHWVTGTAAPCCSLFKPVRVNQPLDLGSAPTDTADDQSLWWRGEKLHRRVMCDPQRLFPKFAAERDAVEAAWIAKRPEPADAFAQGDDLLTRWTADVAAEPVVDRRPGFVRRYWDKRNLRAVVDLNRKTLSPSAEAVR